MKLPHRTTLALPSAPPASYLELASFWHGMAHALAAFRKGAAGDPELEPVASYLVEEVLPQIEAAAAGRDELVTPSLEVDGELMLRTVSDLAWHEDWLEHGVMPGAIGVEMPGPGVLSLRSRVIRAVVEQLAPETGLPESELMPAAG